MGTDSSVSLSSENKDKVFMNKLDDNLKYKESTHIEETVKTLKDGESEIKTTTRKKLSITTNSSDVNKSNRASSKRTS